MITLMSKKKAASDKNNEPKKPRVHKDLEGFEIKVNPLGEITSSHSIEDLNEFLNRNVRDKKLVGRKDLGFEPVDHPQAKKDTPDPEDDDFAEDDFGIDEEDLDNLDSTEGPDEVEIDDDDFDVADDDFADFDEDVEEDDAAR